MPCQLSALLPSRLRGLALGSLLVLLAAAPPAGAQAKYLSAEEAYSAGARFVNSGDLAAAREPLEAARTLAKNDAFRLKACRALLIPYRELPEVAPMQSAAEYILTNSKQEAERSLTRRELLSFIHRRGKMAAAVEEYEARLKKTPDDRTVLYLLAEAYAAYKKDPARSAELTEKLVAADRKAGRGASVSDQAQLAQQYLKSGKLREGAKLFETIAPLDPKLEAWHLKEAAAAWLKAGDRANAVAAAKKSAAAAPEARGALLTYFWNRGLGDVFLAGGEPALAVPHYERALTSTDIDGYLKDTRAKLAEAQAAAKK
ncbi:MAG: tetratricopeptide repeat protein [Gemmataceae bacterium]